MTSFEFPNSPDDERALILALERLAEILMAHAKLLG